MTPPLVDPPPSPAALAAALQDFINHDLPGLHSKVRINPEVGMETPLFSSGIIDSMAILHLLAFVERATGRAIPPERVVMKNFQTIAAIAGTFGTPPCRL